MIYCPCIRIYCSEGIFVKKLLKIIAIIMILSCLPLSVLAEETEAELQPALYPGRVTTRYKTSYTNVYREMNKESETIDSLSAGKKLDILEIYPYWVKVRYGNNVEGYIIRNRVDIFDPYDMVNTPRFGTLKCEFYAEITQDTPVYEAKDENSKQLALMTDGARVALIGFEDGWGVVVFKHQYGYINSNLLEHIYPTAKTVDQGTDEIPIAAYTSFATDAVNRNINLTQCGKRLDAIVLKPGDSLNFNKQVGPFTKANGYVMAGSLVDGGTGESMGGGSCQVSGTIFCTVLQLPGINILERRAHGDNAAGYLPFGMDASSAAQNLNLRIRNDYDFTVRFETVMHDTALTIMVYKVTE